MPTAKEKTTTKSESEASSARSAQRARATARSASAAKTGAKSDASKRSTKASVKSSKTSARRSANGNGYDLVIVESPTKAKTIERYLGGTYKVVASKGHVRDLPKSRLGVDVENSFEPTYEIIPSSKKTVSELKKAASSAASVFLATDFDREGEAIAWHVTQAIGLDPERARRVTFTEITESAIQEAFRQPRPIDMALVNAQQARRVLDRLVGYKLSPLLWAKIRRNLSAGRVQSVALKLIVDREREIQAFKPREYWTVEAKLEKAAGTVGGSASSDTVAGGSGADSAEARCFTATLLKHNGRKVEIGDEKTARAYAEKLRKASFKVAEVRRKEIRRNPPPPFTTSTLQQEASRKLGFTGQRTMAVAQQLYEGIDAGPDGRIGLITYMRTDSVHLSSEAQRAILAEIESRYGRDYVVEKARVYKTKSKGAQEAHEAIRPTYISRDPDSLKPYLTPDQYKLYRLIWQRTLACQMKQAILEQTSVDIEATGGYLLRATGQVRLFDGYMKVYVEGSDEKDKDQDGTQEQEQEKDERAEIDRELPPLEEGEPLRLLDVEADQHFTQPPPRYTDASLVKALEENGIGRPSTYAPTISTLLERGYVVRENKRLVPQELGFVVTEFLEEYFPDIVDVGFTARMEEDLDEIASGKTDWVPVVRGFYDDFSRLLEKTEHEAESHLEDTDETCDLCGSRMVVRLGKYGKFLSCSRYPECKNTKRLTQPQQPQPTGEKCPECGRDLVRREGRFGTFVGCSGYPECKYVKRESKGTGARCPECGSGELVERRTRKGRVFYSCDRFPDCRFASWKKPHSTPCPDCGGTVFFERSSAKCSACGSELELEYQLEA
jgi:DNA topoisomerase-1